MIPLPRLFLSCLAVLLAAACGEGETIRPHVIAHRAGGGYWPENSRTAVHESVARRFPGIEFDVTLTRDLVPVLAHDPWLSEKHCTLADGTPLPGRVLIKDFTLAELQKGYRCGGLPDPDEPDIQPVADTLMTLDEVLDAVGSAPEMMLHLDLKCEPELTPSPQDFAEQIMSRWKGQGLSNPMHVESGWPEVLAAFRARGPVTTSFSWPWFRADASSTPLVLGTELLSRVGLADAVSAAQRAGADGFCLPYQIADRHELQVARSQGLEVQLFTLNTRPLLEYFCEWPVDVLISDTPEEAPCLR